MLTIGSNGTGPHQITLHPDGQTLVVGLGGILTHPDYDRIKLNLGTMEPALILMDRSFGEILARFQPSHELPPLVAMYNNGRYEEIAFGEAIHRELGNYIASIVAHPENDLVAIASPVGGTALIFNGRSGEVVEKATIADCAGVEALAGGDFLVSSGRGTLVRMGKGKPAAEIASMPVQWDHHLV